MPLIDLNERPAAKARRQRLSPAERRKQILDEAIRYFAEVGFDGGTRELAQRLGVTQPLIYRYFPSKEHLIRELYQHVYIDPWRVEWDHLLTDRERPIRERLVEFYLRYTDIVFGRDWLRIYLFAGLKGVEINKWYITFVEERVLRRICGEMRHHFGLPGIDKVPIQAIELEAFWTFHAGIFYYGVRREVYKVPVHVELRTFIDASVDSLLEGLPALMRCAISQ
jgi:AcrR family transcriptional regulator